MRKQYLILLSLVVVIFCFGCDSSSVALPPSDEELLRNFQTNEKDFNLLLQMAEKDSNMVKIGHTSTSNVSSSGITSNSESNRGITNERWHEYRKLFDKLNLKDGITNNQPDLVMFDSFSEGMIMGGSTKGYIFLKNEPENLMHSLDDISFKGSNKSINIVYRKIKDNWYLYHEVD